MKRAGIALASLAALAVSGLGAAYRIEEERLGTIEGRVVSTTRSSDGLHIAQVVERGGKFVVVMDGKDGPAYDGIDGHDVDFSQEGFHFGYVARKGGRMVAVVDGKEGPEYEAIGQIPVDMSEPDYVRLSRDGRRHAYRVRKGGKWVVVVDGNEGPAYEAIGEGPDFCAESKHVYYTAKKGDNRWVAVADGTEGPEYTSVYKLGFSYGAGRLYYWACRGTGAERQRFLVVDGEEWPETEQIETIVRDDGYALRHYEFDPIRYTRGGAHFFYVTERGGKKRVVLDGKEGPPYDAVDGTFKITRDGEHIAYIAYYGPWQAPQESFLVIDGEQRPLPHARPASLRLAPDGKHFTYQAKVGGQAVVVVDGEAGPLYDRVEGPYVSADGTRIAYVAQEGVSEFVVVNGQKGPTYDEIEFEYFGFVNRGKHVCYRARRGEKWLVVVDGKEEREYDEVDRLEFGPDGEHYAYVGHTGDGIMVVHDGREGRKYLEIVRRGTPRFSPDGQHLVYAATWLEDGKCVVVLDGQEGPAFDELLGVPVFTPDSQHLAYAISMAQQVPPMQAVVIDGERGKLYEELADRSLAGVRNYGHLAYLARRGDAWYHVRHVPAQEG